VSGKISELLNAHFIGGTLKLIYSKERRIMRTTNQIIILTVVTTILSVPALANISSPLEDEPDAILIGQPHPELAGIEELYVVIKLFDTDPGKGGLVGKELDKLVRDRLRNAGITIAEDDLDKINPDMKKVLLRHLKEKDVRNLKLRVANIPELRVDIEIITLDNSQQHVFRVQTSLARSVHLATQPKLGFRADVWKEKALMQSVSVQNMPSKVTKTVLEQVDAFIADYRLANPPGKETADANDIATVLPVVTPRQTTPVTKPTTATYKYVASKNSKVFHKPDCIWANRIKPANLVTFSTRDQAIQAGKRPCKQCKP
jgi:hypothetical protein